MLGAWEVAEKCGGSGGGATSLPPVCGRRPGRGRQQAECSGRRTGPSIAVAQWSAATRHLHALQWAARKGADVLPRRPALPAAAGGGGGAGAGGGAAQHNRDVAAQVRASPQSFKSQRSWAAFLTC